MSSDESESIEAYIQQVPTESGNKTAIYVLFLCSSENWFKKGVAETSNKIELGCVMVYGWIESKWSNKTVTSGAVE